MSNLKIKRINKSRYQVRNGSEIVRECASFQEAMNAMINEDIRQLDENAEFCDSSLDDMDLIFAMQAVG